MDMSRFKRSVSGATFRLRRPGVIAFVAFGLALTGGAATYAAVVAEHPGPQGDGTGITPTGWHVTPAGRQLVLGERPYGMAVSPDGRHALVSNDGLARQSVMLVDTASNKVTAHVDYPPPQAVFLGVAWSPDGRRAYVSAGANDLVRVYDVSGGSLTETAPLKLSTAGTPTTSFAAGITLSADGRTLWVADHLANSVSVVDTASGAETRIPLSERTCTRNAFGSDPSGGVNCEFAYTVGLSRNGRTAYVSSWGKNYLTTVDTATRKVTGRVTVGTHPSALAASPVRDELYAANTDADTISVVDTATNRVRRTIPLSPYPGAAVGSQPNSLAVSRDGGRLFAANAGNNDIDVVALADGRGHRDELLGLIPTGWYPTAVGLSPGNDRIYVANAKGLGAGPNPAGPNPTSGTTDPDQYVGSMIKGTLSSISMPRSGELREYTRQVQANGGFDRRQHLDAARDIQHVVPLDAQHPSPIRHVIYIVNENRTYDQVLGDLGKGNGDASITLFGKDIAPNHHRLADQFVTLDNLYAAGEVSDDGWEWSTAANANTLDQKSMPTTYGGRGHFYVGEGGTLAAAPGRDPDNSYIWDRLDRKGLSYRNYGFWATDTPPVDVYNEPTLDAHTDHAYAGFNMAIPDQTRYAEWEKEFTGYERAGSLPTVEFLKFPRDHTCGTSPSCPTPQAMVADSDLALGKLVDRVSHSRFWNDTAIFVIEDDAQDGPDHVDAHRTLAHVISPYTQTGKVDSTFYSTVSMLRTMELILGVAPLTQFDAAATPMVRSFTDHPRFTPYTVAVPKIDLNTPNPPNAPLSRESSQMDFTKEDRAPEALLNRAIWESVKGAGKPMPAHKSGVPDNDGD
jgi:YVTN family beta-propeller protein